MASDEALPELLNSIQTTLTSSQRQLGIVSAQANGRQREARLQELTSEQLQELGPETKVYRGVGKMFMHEDFKEVIANTQARRKAALEEKDMLHSKQKFLEKKVSDAQSHLNDLVRSLEKAGQAA